MTRTEPLYDCDWQKLRVSLLQENNDYGGFSTEIGVALNIVQLQKYANNLISKSDFMALPKVGSALKGASRVVLTEAYLRNWRILNLMNATLLGYGSKMYGTVQAELVGAYQLECGDTHQAFTHAGFGFNVIGEWDWGQVESGLRTMISNDIKSYKRIRDDLTKRRKVAMKRGGISHRPELVRFLELMEIILIQHAKTMEA